MSLFGRRKRPAPPLTPEPPPPPPSLPAIHSTPSLPELARTYGISLPPQQDTEEEEGGGRPSNVGSVSVNGHGKSIAEMYKREEFVNSPSARQTGYRPPSFLYSPGSAPPIPSLSALRSAKARNRAPRSTKAPQTFNLVVVGDSGTGKSSYFRTLLATFGNGAEDQFVVGGKTTVEVVSEEGERIKLSVVDTKGLGMSEGRDELETERRLGKVVRLCEEKFEEVLVEEGQVYRTTSKSHDAFIHLCLYFLNHSSILPRPSTSHTNGVSSLSSPSLPASAEADERGFGDQTKEQLTISPLDLRLIKRLSARANVLPVIGRADELTEERLRECKEAVRRDLGRIGIGGGGWGVFGREGVDEDEEEELAVPVQGRGRSKSVKSEAAITEEGEEENEEGEVEGEEEEEEEQPKVIKVRSRSPHVSKSPNPQPSTPKATPRRKSLHFGGAPAWGISNGGVDEPPLPDVAEVLPFALISPENPWAKDGPGKFERKFKWGRVEVLNEEHCDFEPLRRAVFGGYFKLLKDSTRQEKYEPFRTQRLLARRATRNISSEQREELLKDLEKGATLGLGAAVPLPESRATSVDHH
ncbi:hypothetical protein BT69DRAFT_1292469 [Atractiella rhizophila]|nr:hypothetical protein BT69DRAFT_1292469 [Atractiella rhizophila]